jgi:HlyD family secretion protein
MLERLDVREGDVVAPDAFLFELDDTADAAALRAARAREAVAEAELHNLETGSRIEEIAVIRASLAQAEADQSLAHTNLERAKGLFDRDVVTMARVDDARAALERADAQVAQLRAQLDVAELPARDAQIVAAQASLEAARAEVAQVQAAFDDLTVHAPVGGLIEKLYFEPGEVVPAGTPVLSLLPPGQLKVLFFIPEPDRMSFTLGQKLALTCDGCAQGLQVEIVRMGSEPQYTPPIIYSREERTRFVYRAEARLVSDAPLLPGQPVTLEPLP